METIQNTIFNHRPSSEVPVTFDLSIAIADQLRDCFYVNGQWVRSHSKRQTTLVSPVTEGELLALPLADATDVDRVVVAARAAFDKGPWPRMSGAERAGYLVRLADEIRKRLPMLAQLWTLQVGAPISFANHLIHAGESRFDYFAELAAPTISMTCVQPRVGTPGCDASQSGSRR